MLILKLEQMTMKRELVEETKRKMNHNQWQLNCITLDESLFFSIPLALMYPFDSYSVLNCSSLECFSSIGLYWATVPNLD